MVCVLSVVYVRLCMFVLCVVRNVYVCVSGRVACAWATYKSSRELRLVSAEIPGLITGIEFELRSSNTREGR